MSERHRQLGEPVRKFRHDELGHLYEYKLLSTRVTDGYVDAYLDGFRVVTKTVRKPSGEGTDHLISVLFHDKVGGHMEVRILGNRIWLREGLEAKHIEIDREKLFERAADFGLSDMHRARVRARLDRLPLYDEREYREHKFNESS